MNSRHRLHPKINLHVEGRITEEDASRQLKTAEEILHRLKDQPGLVLADEVGMGKTFVALAVAISVALSDKRRRPVVVMVPPALAKKWPGDFRVFQEHCLPADLQKKVHCASADRGVAFLKLLDDPVQERASVIFLTHGAMSRSLKDSWVKLAIIHRALLKRKDARLREAVISCAASLIELKSRERHNRELFADLLGAPPDRWLGIMQKHGMEETDEPVPETVIQALRRFRVNEFYNQLSEHIPRNKSPNYEDRVRKAREALNSSLQQLWKNCLQHLQFRLPLLILDEAHHLKNPYTRLAGLFRSEEAEADAQELSRGALAGVFERMLLLTATPFQLGHVELCSVLNRFEGIAWKSKQPPSLGKAGFQEQINALQGRLDEAQEAAAVLDSLWGRLSLSDLVVDGTRFTDVEAWWKALPEGKSLEPASLAILKAYKRTCKNMRAAEVVLRPWVIRHLRPRTLPNYGNAPRRLRLVGRGIHDDIEGEDRPGLEIPDASMLPFLIAARATVCSPSTRPVFAEGLASSYDAFRNTRRQKEAALDTDASRDDVSAKTEGVLKWYLEQLDAALPLENVANSASHPKVAATTNRVVQLWEKGEKVIVFCHFIQSGRVLRRVISARLRELIFGQAAKRLRRNPDQAEALLRRIGERFSVSSPAWRETSAIVGELLEHHPALYPHRERLIEVTVRFLRTPAFLVRYFPIENCDNMAKGVRKAFDKSDSSNLTLHKMLGQFFEFLAKQNIESEREELLEAIGKTQTGDISSFTEDERQEEDLEGILPNIRLANGQNAAETRRRLMLTFNSPFFPEILVASSVMAEGVDLHRFCRHVIHHDLDWNPSALEQRTGRIDRIGAKVENCGIPIRVYLPFLAGTQDERQFRVVMDRERWFNVVMGEKFKVDTQTTEAIAERLTFPASAAAGLAFRLNIS